MRGTIQKSGAQGVTSYRIRVADGTDRSTGTRRFVTETVRGTRKEAERRLREIITELESNRRVAPANLTVGGLLDRWLETVRPAVRPSTAEGYTHYCAAYLKPYLGSVMLQRLTPEHVQVAYTALLTGGGKRGQGLSQRTVHHAHCTLAEALRYAVRAKLITLSPCDAVTVPRFDRKEIRALEPTEVAAVFVEMQKRSPWAYWPSALALLTGARRSEILAFTWADVNLNGQEPSVSVRRGFTRLTGGDEVIRPPKTARSARNIALGPRAVQLLHEWRAEREKEARLLERPVPEWVFSDPLGHAYKPSSVSQAFRRACRAAGVEGATFHSLRHTHATGMLKANVHPAVVQQRLGHSTIATTIDLYSHVAPALQAQAAERFDEAFDLSLPALPEPAETQ